VGYILAHSGARFLLLDTRLEGLAGQAGLAGVRVIRCAGDGGPGDRYEGFLAGAPPVRPVSWLGDEEETISVNYTSGTTGRPKGVQYSYRGAYLNALGEVIVAGLGAGSVYLWTLPMFHCNGWCFPWAVTAAAARHVMMPAVDPARVWELIDGEGVTHYNAAPTVQLMILNHPRAHRLGRPVTAMVAAAPPSPNRGKDIIISGGENISSIEVEQAITAHPAVLECAVIGIPHPHWGERPKAFITLNQDAAATPEEIIAFCRDRLARYKCPDTVQFGPLPKTSTGKIQKFVLRDREWAGHDNKIGRA